jgi:nitric oxide reductase subunit B
MINPPVALYYMQELNTTPVHGHAALFGVYGMLGMGLMLFSLRAMEPGRQWREGVIRFAFWTINIGLLAMVVLSLLPVGLLQTWASVSSSGCRPGIPTSRRRSPRIPTTARRRTRTDYDGGR